MGEPMLEATTGELVRVRAYCEGDIDAVHRAVFESVPELSPFETWCTTGFTRDQAAGYVNGWLQAWAAGTAFYFAVEDLESGDYVGSCGLSGILRVHRRACLGPATERIPAIKVYLDFGFLPDMAKPRAHEAWEGVQAALRHPALEICLRGV